MEIPASVREIGDEAFYGCKQLVKVVIEGALSNVIGGNKGTDAGVPPKLSS